MRHNCSLKRKRIRKDLIFTLHACLSLPPVSVSLLIHDYSGGSNWSGAIRAMVGFQPSIRKLNGAEFSMLLGPASHPLTVCQDIGSRPER